MTFTPYNPMPTVLHLGTFSAWSLIFLCHFSDVPFTIAFSVAYFLSPACGLIINIVFPACISVNTF